MNLGPTANTVHVGGPHGKAELAVLGGNRGAIVTGAKEISAGNKTA